MSLRLNGSTSGYVEIDAPATAGSNTLTLPNGNGTGGQYLQTNGSGGLSWAGVTTGKVLQVVQAQSTTETATNSATLVDTGLSGSITPVAANSKILVITDAHVRIWGGLYPGFGCALLRGSTKIFGDVDDQEFYLEPSGVPNNYIAFKWVMHKLDTPTYTLGNSITYKTQARRVAASNTVWQQNSRESTITLMEVAA